MPRYTPKGKATKAESIRMAIVKQMGCFRCGQFGVDVHHLVDCGRRLGNAWILPLCKFHHLNIFQLTFAEQLEMCRELYKKQGWEWQEPETKIVKRKLLH